MPTRRIRLWFLMVAVLAAGSGLAACASIRDRELVDRPLPESYLLPNPPAKVWQAINAEASRPGLRILVRDPDARVISWISEIEEDATLHSSLADPEIASRGEKVMAITLLRARAIPGGCRLIIRQLYFPADRASGGASASRGTYEEALVRQIRRRLEAGG